MTERPHPAFPYSPERRTAVVLTGTGADGAYHAGALRALHDAGVKVDLVAGHGIGAAGAALGAIDGAARLWEPAGLWQAPSARAAYGWTWPVRAAGWLVLLLAIVVALPLFVLAAGVAVHLAAFLLGVFGTAAGPALGDAFAGWQARLFAPDQLPAQIPPLALIVLAALGGVLAAGAIVDRWRAPARRRAAGAVWWRLLGAPLDAAPARDAVIRAVGDLIQGPAALARPALARRYTELIEENLGHPGFRELVIVATDLDARRDIVAVLLREPFRGDVAGGRGGADPPPEVVDLAGAGRELALDLVAAAATPPIACDPYLVTFSPDSAWRGETHRLCDRPGSITRLLEEVAAAGVTQVIVVSAVAPGAGPHRLSPPRLDLRSRLGEVLAADAAAALRDALAVARLRFDSIYVIAPVHNPIGPFHTGGAYDAASDRWQDLGELVARGYDDAGRQFIAPVVAASGERLGADQPWSSPGAAAEPSAIFGRSRPGESTPARV